MKKVAMLALMCAFVVGLCATTFAQSGIKDSVLVAKILAEKPISYKTIYGLYECTKSNGEIDYHHLRAIYREDTGITYLVIDDIRVEGVDKENPIKYLPAPKGDYVQVVFWSDTLAIDVSGTQSMWGYANDYDLKPNKGIRYMMALLPRQSLIPYTPQQTGELVNIRIYHPDGWWSEFGLNYELGGFLVSLDPSVRYFLYEIFGGSGNLLDTGILQSTSGVGSGGGSGDGGAGNGGNLQSFGNAVSFELPGGVIEVDLNQSRYFSGLELDGQTEIGGSVESAKVFLINNLNNPFSGYIQMNGFGPQLDETRIVCLGVDENGQTTELSLTTDTFGSTTVWFSVGEIARHYRHIIFVVLDIESVDDKFNIIFFPDGGKV